MSKARIVIAMALFILGITTASASAVLPKVALLEGEKFPLTVTNEITTTKGIQVETVGGNKFICTARKTTLSWNEPSPLGTYVLDYTGCKDGALPCHTFGDPQETMLLTGEFHFVPVPGGGDAIAYLQPMAYIIFCGAKEEVKVKEEGTFLEAYNGEFKKDITTFKGGDKGAKGKPALTKYLNEEGKEVEASLKLNFGLGFETADLNIEKELEYQTKMMFILS